MQNISDLILDITSMKQVDHVESVQSLWSGYGYIKRYHLSNDGNQSTSVVVKHINLNDAQKDHPRGWATDLSHLRKKKSYDVEKHWYLEQSKQCDDSCKIPELYHSEENSGELLLIMEDLRTSGYNVLKSSVNFQELKYCLKWLANFHAKFINEKPVGLWEVGTYWNLDTRPDEWNCMQNTQLKEAARTIDAKLTHAKYQTIVHGDAKLANFCFSESGEVAAVDFQYVGGGCGMKDVAYLISSCLDAGECFRYENQALKYYFKQLKQALNLNDKKVDVEELVQEWSELYTWAWADFCRFLDGWSPNHWKFHAYAQHMTGTVLK